MQIQGVNLGLACGSVPTAAMILVSALLSTLKVHPRIEAVFQNFAGGLILGAVASELFPLILGADKRDGWIGMTAGFGFALILLNGIDSFVELLFKLASKSNCRKTTPTSNTNYEELEDDVKKKEISKVVTETGEELSDVASHDDRPWEQEDLQQAEAAISLPNHRMHIKEHLIEVTNLIKHMENQANCLVDNDGNSIELDAMAEQIDEDIHKLQYKLDHCRRLIQGSEAQIPGDSPRAPRMTEEKKIELLKRLSVLRCTANHLVEHILEDKIDKYVLSEMVLHIKEMGHRLEMLHDTVDAVASKWRHSQPMPSPEEGAKLPTTLIVPVTIDCFVDGFLIGLSVAVSPIAGFVLAAANSLEMSFLGMAYSARLSKCTGSSLIARQAALYLPCLLMFFASGFGSFAAEAARDYPAVFVSFVSFGVTALISLVCCELLIEARESQGDEAKWWVQLFIFAGVYVVLMSFHVV